MAIIDFNHDEFVMGKVILMELNRSGLLQKGVWQNSMG